MTLTLEPREFDRIRQLLYAESAIVLDPGKEYLVESRLGPLIRRESLGSFGELADLISSPAGQALRTSVIDAMTTNETSFFRDAHPWETLRDHLLPALIEARRDHRRLTVWCAASSSGQEPYSLAMLIHEHFPEVARDWTVKIIGTDLSPTMVARSAAGRFSQLEVNRGLPATMLVRYFSRVGSEWEIGESIRAMVDFRLGNLIEPSSWGLIPLVDAVFMRNVLIYFDDTTRAEIVERVHGRLRSDGFLLLGSAETPAGTRRYERVQFGKTSVFAPVPPGFPVDPRPSVRRPVVAP